MNAADSLPFLEHYGVVILPALAVAEQIGVPLPAVPALLAVGALAAHGRISIPLVLGRSPSRPSPLTLPGTNSAVAAGRGCWQDFAGCPSSRTRACAEPRTSSAAMAHGACSSQSFVPGLTTVLPPLAGVFAVPRVRFALYDLAGVLLWAGTWLALGYFFSDAIVLITAEPRRSGACSASSS